MGQHSFYTYQMRKLQLQNVLLDRPLAALAAAPIEGLGKLQFHAFVRKCVSFINSLTIKSVGKSSVGLSRSNLIRKHNKASNLTIKKISFGKRDSENSPELVGWEFQVKCDQIWRFFGHWATFQSLWQQVICPILLHSQAFL